MKRDALILLIMAIAIFLGASFANTHPAGNSNKETSTISSRESTNTPPNPVSTDRGRLLYENHCTACHDQYVHSRSNKKSNSVQDIRQWVIRWSRNLELDWHNDDIKMVTDYLNQQFYKFPTQD